jgi:pyrroline-5-carboxylate reductase
MNITLIGAGKMTQALLQAWRQSPVFEDHHITLSSPRYDQISALKEQYPLHITTDNQAAVGDADLVVFAVRPNQLETVLRQVHSLLKPDAWIISLAAIGSLAWLESKLPHHKICRLIPSSSMSQRIGCIALSKNTLAQEADFTGVQAVLNPLGSVVLLKEAQLDAFIAVSASGLAYIYVMMRLYQDAAEDLGLSEDLAHQLVQASFQSASLMANFDSYEHLISKVATPGGTTEAGLSAFDRLQFKANLDAVFSATLKKISQTKIDLDMHE